MKRLFLSFVALAAVLASCSKSDLIDAPNADAIIQFNPYIGKAPLAKATVADKISLGVDGIQVYGYSHDANGGSERVYFNKVVTNAEGEGWTYEGAAYWPATLQLDFLAYGKDDNHINDLENKSIEFTVDDNVADQKDLLVATPLKDQTFSTSNNGQVTLNFSHLLSKVGFSLITTAPHNLDVTISKLVLRGNFYKKGTVDLTATKETTLNLGQNNAAATDKRPFIVPSPEAREWVEYKLLSSNYVGKGSAEGEPICSTSKENERYMMLIPVNSEEGNPWGSFTLGEEDDAAIIENAQLVVAFSLPDADPFPEMVVDLVTKDENDNVVPIQFHPGRSYEFKIKISTNQISFDVTVDSWDESGNYIGSDEVFILN